jgi:hypothetical protein
LQLFSAEFAGREATDFSRALAKLQGLLDQISELDRKGPGLPERLYRKQQRGHDKS